MFSRSPGLSRIIGYLVSSPGKIDRICCKSTALWGPDLVADTALEPCAERRATPAKEHQRFVVAWLDWGAIHCRGKQNTYRRKSCLSRDEGRRRSPFLVDR